MTRPLTAGSSQIRNALIALLGADAQLLALMPNGVYFAVAPQGATRYVLVALHVADPDESTFDAGRAIVSAVWTVQAVGFRSAHPDMPAAEARIDELLDDQPLTVAGYGWITMHRETAVDYVERDSVNPAIIVDHRGADYRITMTPTGTTGE